MAAADTVLHLEKWRADPNKFTLSASKLRHVSQDDFRKHWFERRESQEGVFEFFKGGNTTKADYEGGENRAKPRRKRGMPAEGVEEKAKRVRPSVLAALREMVTAGEKTDQVSIAKKCVMQKQVVVKALKMLEENGDVKGLRESSGPLTYALLASVGNTPPAEPGASGVG